MSSEVLLTSTALCVIRYFATRTLILVALTVYFWQQCYLFRWADQRSRKHVVFFLIFSSTTDVLLGTFNTICSTGALGFWDSKVNFAGNVSFEGNHANVSGGEGKF